MSDVTRILSDVEQGDPSAVEQLLPLVYDELRKLAAQRLAQEKPGQTLQVTALIHKAYIRQVDVAKVQRMPSPCGRAGAGVCGGKVYGSTDEFGDYVVGNKVTIPDLHATILHLLGLDHTHGPTATPAAIFG